MMRFVFMAAVIVPAFIRYNILPAIITLFLISSTAGYVEGLMPSQLYWYVLVSWLAAIMKLREHSTNSLGPISLVIVLVDVTLVNLLYDSAIEHITYSILIILSFLLIIRSRGENLLSLLSLVFALISLSLAVMFVMAAPSNMASYGYSGFERVDAFSDPNYFGCFLGMGALASVIEVFRDTKKNILLKYFYVFVALFSFVVLVLNASRGGILAFALSSAFILFFLKTKKGIKALVVVLLSALLLILYKNDYFALLEYRVMNDTGGGSSRTTIWLYKLNEFFNNSSLFQLIFGYGHNGGLAIGGGAFGYGGGKILGFHNDLVAFLVDYGFVGLISFLSLIIYIFKQTRQNQKLKVYGYAVLLFLLVHMMTLEPYTAGGLPIWAFTMYSLLLAQTIPNNKQ